MYGPALDARRALVASILVAALCHAQPTSAEIYKCVAKNGAALYQNFPCQYDSNPQDVKVIANSSTANQAAPKPVPVNMVAPAPAKPTDLNEPRIGMLTDEVRALLGEPIEIATDQPVDGEETWRYETRKIFFDRWHRVQELKSL